MKIISKMQVAGSIQYEYNIISDEIVAMWLFYILTWILFIIVCIRKVGQLVLRFQAFVDEKENLFELPMLATIFASLVAVRYNIVWQTHLGAFAVLFICLKVTMLIGRFPTFGVYINMALNIFWTLVMFFGIFFFTFLGTYLAQTFKLQSIRHDSPLKKV